METTTPGGIARRPVLVAAAVVIVLAALVLVALGRDTGPPVIRIADGERAAAEAEVAMDSFPAMGEVHFELTDTARFGAGEGLAWRLEPPSDLRAAATDLASRLGIDAATLTTEGDGLRIGGDDGTGATLWVGPTGEWSFYDPGPLVEPACVEPTEPGAVEHRAGVDGAEPDVAAPDEADPGEPTDPDEPVTDDPDGGEPRSEPSALPCEPVAPDADVPDEARARAAAEVFLAGLDLDDDVRIVDVHADSWGAWVTATRSVGDVASDLHVSVALGAQAGVTSATGTLARPVEADRYPTIDADAAVTRLGEQQGSMGLLPVPEVDPAVPDEIAEAEDRPTASGDHGGGVDGDEVERLLPAPDPAGEVAPRTVTLVAAEPAVLLTADTDRVVWLLPGVRFTDSEGGTWQVLTVADDHLDQPGGDEGAPGHAPVPSPTGPDDEEPVGPPEPGGVEPGDPGGDDPAHRTADVVAHDVVGMSEVEAVAHIEAAGFEARTVQRDDEGLPVTDDLRPDRINLRVEDDRVVHAEVY